jgi:hypothetical protein
VVRQQLPRATSGVIGQASAGATGDFETWWRLARTLTR